MKEPYVEGSSDPPRPRVMAVCPQGRTASVDRGARRPAIELRNHLTGAPTSCNEREGNTMSGDIASRYIGPAESKTLRMRGSSMHENREIPSAPVGSDRKSSPGRSGKVCGHNPDVYAVGKSHIGVVPVNAGNKAGRGEIRVLWWNCAPYRDRKSGIGNPPPTVMRIAFYVWSRTCGRKGR